MYHVQVLLKTTQLLLHQKPIRKKHEVAKVMQIEQYFKGRREAWIDQLKEGDYVYKNNVYIYIYKKGILVPKYRSKKGRILYYMTFL